MYRKIYGETLFFLRKILFCAKLIAVVYIFFLKNLVCKIVIINILQTKAQNYIIFFAIIFLYFIKKLYLCSRFFKHKF
jgi:hypothetical protein